LLGITAVPVADGPPAAEDTAYRLFGCVTELCRWAVAIRIDIYSMGKLVD
jgi:hypothetical protein